MGVCVCTDAFKDMHNQVLNALFNLCKINRARQEQAARAGIVPHLKEIISANRYSIV